MADIVSTIQAEQDHVIRAPHGGVLVVQGGAGTGKTAVALHRAAYLLYTYRQQLERRGVLVVGPNSTFLRYIGDVLPALGETAVVLAPVSGLFPGVSADRPEPEDVAEIKGRAAMAGVLATAVKDRQRVPDGALVLLVDGETGADPGRGDPARPHRGPAHPAAAQPGPAGVRGAVRRRGGGRVRRRPRRAVRRRAVAGRSRRRARPRPAHRASSATTRRCSTRWTSCGRA